MPVTKKIPCSPSHKAMQNLKLIFEVRTLKATNIPQEAYSQYAAFHDFPFKYYSNSYLQYRQQYFGGSSKCLTNF